MIDDDTIPPTVDELRFQVLQDKVLDDTITQRQLVEYERLKINEVCNMANTFLLMES